MFESNLLAVRVHTDRLFFFLLIAQWVLGIAIAIVNSPRAVSGEGDETHVHVQFAILAGAVINSLPLVLVRLRPGWWVTRHVVAAAQMLWSAAFIHLTGGRIETHFHVFCSLAIVAFYRDWRCLVTASAIVAADHLVRGYFWPESVYGIANPEWWRFLEHAAWIAIAAIVLVRGCFRSIAEMKFVATRETELERLNANIESQDRKRRAELTVASESLTQEMKTRLQVELELRQAQKLESVGRLASGVAHEINTPVQYVSDSLHFLRDATNDLIALVEKLRMVRRSVAEGTPTAAAALEAAAAEEAADLPYLLENVPKAFDRSLDGLGRVATIVRSMKAFAHPDSKEMATVDLNQAIESTLTIARNEYKYVADVETDFGEIPRVMCFAGEINQAILNIVVNAAHAIGDVVKGTGEKGRIVVRTRRDGEHAVVSISDTGGGIPEEIRERIFDQFFTTKKVGRGTGQGLAIARSVVVEKHQGELRVESEMGRGSTFVIRVPIGGRASSSDEPGVTA